MIALIQRVREASVQVDNIVIAKIKIGLLVLLAVEKNDSESEADRLVQRLLNYRVFADEHDKMNVNVQEINAGILLVPQFTLAANTNKGNRPSFTSAATPTDGKFLFDYFISTIRTQYNNIETGQFAANMQVALINDGPVTFWLQVKPKLLSS